MTKRRSTILLLGDSLTQLGWDGWVGTIANVYQRRADVINRGFGGYNTKWFLLQSSAQESDIWSFSQVGLIVIFFGANDASDPILNPRHHVPIPDYQENLRTIRRHCQEHYGSDVPIIFITPPPVVHSQRLTYQIQRYGDNATGKLERNMALSEQYASAAEEMATEVGVPCLNLWKAMQKDDGWKDFFTDGLHFSKTGNDFVAQALLKTIAQHYPDLAVTPCPQTQQYASSTSKCTGLTNEAPWHDEIDYQNPTAAFAKKQQEVVDR